MGCITGKAWRVSGISSAGAVRVGGIKAYASLICTVDKGTILKVIPPEPQWVDVNMSATYAVISNVKWVIK